MKILVNITLLFLVLGIQSCRGQNQNNEIHSSNLSSIDTAFVQNESESLSLKGVKEIPAKTFEQSQLTYLSVWGQDCDIAGIECFAISEIPPEIKKLKNLEELYLTLNYIKKLPVEILELKKLRILDLTENPSFNDIEKVTKMKWLNEFYCFGCHLTDSDIKKLKKELPDCKIGIE